MSHFEIFSARQQQQQWQQVSEFSDFEIFLKDDKQALISPSALPSPQTLQPILVARESIGGRDVKPGGQQIQNWRLQEKNKTVSMFEILFGARNWQKLVRLDDTSFR